MSIAGIWPPAAAATIVVLVIAMYLLDLWCSSSPSAHAGVLLGSKQLPGAGYCPSSSSCYPQSTSALSFPLHSTVLKEPSSSFPSRSNPRSQAALGCIPVSSTSYRRSSCATADSLNATPQSVLQLVFDVSCYGACPNDNIDDSAAVQRAIDAAIGSGVASIVQFQSGIYNFTSTLGINQCNDLTIAGTASSSTLLVWNRKVGAVAFNHCSGLTFLSLSIDYYPLPFTAGTVISSNSTAFTLSIVPPHTAQVTKGVGRMIRYDLANSREAIGSLTGVYFPSNGWTELVVPGILTVFVDEQPWKLGDDVIIELGGSGPHTINGGYSSNVVVDDLTILSSCDMAFHTYAVNGTTMTNFHVHRGIGTWLSTNADCINLGSALGATVITSSSCLDEADDAINVNQADFTIIQILNSSSIVIETNYPPPVGTEMAFSSSTAPFVTYASATIASLSCNSSDACVTNLATAVAEARVGDVVTTSGSASLWVSNFTTTQGFDLATPNVFITNVSFLYSPGPAVRMTPNVLGNGVPAAHNVTITNSLMLGVGQGYIANAVISIIPSTSLPIAFIGNVLIQGNTIIQGQYSPPVLYNENGLNVTFVENYVDSSNATSPVFFICNSQGWNISHNSIIGSSNLLTFCQPDTSIGCLSSDAFNATGLLSSPCVSFLAPVSNQSWNAPLVSNYTDVAHLNYLSFLQPLASAACLPSFQPVVSPTGVKSSAYYAPCSGTSQGLAISTFYPVNFTVEFWVHFPATASYGDVILLGLSRASLYLLTSPTTPPFLGFFNTPGANLPYINYAGYPIGWTHLAITWSSGSRIIASYCNSSLLIEGILAEPGPNRNTFDSPVLGNQPGYYSSANAYFTGYQAWPSVRTALQIQNSYLASGGKLGVPGPLVVSTKYFAGNTYWLVQAVNHSACVQATAALSLVTIAGCNASTTNQKWRYDKGITLASVGLPGQSLNIFSGCALGNSIGVYFYGSYFRYDESTMLFTLCTGLCLQASGSLLTAASCNASHAGQRWMFGYQVLTYP